MPDLTMYWDALSAVGSVLSAGAAAAATYFAYHTVVLMRQQNDPKVVVYVVADADRPSVLMIRVKNVGGDVASNVRFTSSRPIPVKAHGLAEGISFPSPHVMTSGPLIDGIAQLGPGDCRDITWGQIGGIKKSLGRDSLELSFSYSEGKRRFLGNAVLEVDSFMGTDASADPPLRVARAVEEIAECMKALASRLNKVAEAE